MEKVFWKGGREGGRKGREEGRKGWGYSDQAQVVQIKWLHNLVLLSIYAVNQIVIERERSSHYIAYWSRLVGLRMLDFGTSKIENTPLNLHKEHDGNETV